MLKRFRPLIFVAAFALIGGLATFLIFAASAPGAGFEPETGAVTGNALKLTNLSGASNSGAVQFKAPATGGPTGKRCLVNMHGRSSYGGDTYFDDTYNYYVVRPTANQADYPNEPNNPNHTWIYFPESGYQEVQAVIANAIAGDNCGQVIIHGFSNGAAAAAKLYCRGNTFGNKVVGYIIDDPVEDHGVDNCQRPAGVKVRLYTSGDIDWPAGQSCEQIHYTCDGTTLLGVSAYAAALGTTRVQSIQTGHAPYDNPPEQTSWWNP